MMDSVRDYVLEAGHSLKGFWQFWKVRFFCKFFPLLSLFSLYFDYVIFLFYFIMFPDFA